MFAWAGEKGECHETKDGAKTTNQRQEAAVPSLREWLKDPKVLLLISVALNAAFVAIIARDGDTSITTPYFTLSLAKFDLNDHVKALFTKGTDLPQVRAMLAEKHFYEISPDNPETDPIARALVDLADSHFAHALVARLRDMSR